MRSLPRTQPFLLAERCDFTEADLRAHLQVMEEFAGTGVEAMTAGCVSVVPLRGGCVDYAVGGENSLVVDTRDENAIFLAVSRLITDQSFRQRLSCNGLQTARRYTMSKNALSIYLLLARRYYQRSGEVRVYPLCRRRGASPQGRRYVSG